MLRIRTKLIAATAASAVLALGLTAAPPALAIDAEITIWSPKTVNSRVRNDPNATAIDTAGLTNHVSTEANPVTIATVFENTNCSGLPCGVTYWNPETNAFRCYGYSGGAMTGIDIDRGTPGLTAPDGTTYGPGDTWLFKSGRLAAAGPSRANCSSQCSLTVQFPGTDDFRHWDAGTLSAGAVDQSNGRIWMTDRLSGGFISRFNPATNLLERYRVGGSPRDIVLDSSGRAYATVQRRAAADVDRIVRVDATTGEVRTWAVPGGGFGTTLSSSRENPDGIDIDLDGRIWFAESVSDEIGRLDPVTNTICEMTKTGLDQPQNLSTSGSGIVQQAYFSELTGSAPLPITGSPSRGAIGVLTSSEADLLGPGPAGATQVCVVVAPVVTFPAPSLVTLVHTNRTRIPEVFNVPPVTTIVDGIDGVPGSGNLCTDGPNEIPESAGAPPCGGDDEAIPSIIRFPIPAGSVGPVGMTKVAVANTVFGSLIGTEEMFRIKSGPPNGAIIAPPVDVCDPDSPAFLDADDDGICDPLDNCVATANADQADGDADGLGNVCDNCAEDPNADQADLDIDGLGDVCDVCVADAANDADNDGVCGDVDFCLGSTADAFDGEIGVNRFANTILANAPGDDPLLLDTFETTAPKGGGSGPMRVYTTEDTEGCSCSQILDRLSSEDGEEDVIVAVGEAPVRKGHRKFGCSISIMDRWVALIAAEGEALLASADASFAAAVLICEEEALASIE